MVNNMKRRKQKANTSKPAPSPQLNAPAQALSGDETKRRMALVNADREIVRKIMTEPGPRWEPQSPPRAENAANFFRWFSSKALAYRQSGTAEIHRRGPKMRPTFFGRARGRRGLTRRIEALQAQRKPPEQRIFTVLVRNHMRTDEEIARFCAEHGVTDSDLLIAQILVPFETRPGETAKDAYERELRAMARR